MFTTLARLKNKRMFILAMIVPSMIMLIFSLFNMTAPLDPERAASAFRPDENLSKLPFYFSYIFFVFKIKSILNDIYKSLKK